MAAPTRCARRPRGTRLLHAAAAEAGRAVRRGLIDRHTAERAVAAMIAEAVIDNRFDGDVHALRIRLERTARRAEATA